VSAPKRRKEQRFELMLCDQEVGRDYSVGAGTRAQLLPELKRWLAHGRDAWLRPVRSHERKYADAFTATESTIWWVWRNVETGGLGMGRIYGHKSGACEDAWLGRDGHELCRVRLTIHSVESKTTKRP
jgi:hypothetical protein